jgi:hypothetical protein
MSVRSGDGSPVLLRGKDGSEAPSLSPRAQMVETTSPPRPVAPRPQAPPLSFPPAPSPTAKSLESLHHDGLRRDRGALHEISHDETPRDDTGRDDVSVPPVGLDGGFFDDPVSAESLELDARDSRAAMKLTPRAARRRAHLAKYVTAAVVLASALCATALVKITVARGREEPQPRLASAGLAATARTALNSEPTTEPAPSPVPAAISAPAGGSETVEGTAAAQPGQGSAEPAPPTERAAQPAAAAPAGAAAAPAALEPAQAAAAPAEVAPALPSEVAPPTADTASQPLLDPKATAKEAAKEKAKSRGALEWGKMADAIAAGERSVSLDPSDAEAWLILGAAYQQKGDSKNALRSFKACVDQGKRGPKNDCAAMLR